MTSNEPDDQPPTMLGPSDPFDIDALREAPPSDVTVEKLLVNVPVRKPGRQEFFRVHPGLEYVVDCVVFVREEGFQKEVWWVAPGLRAQLAQEVHVMRLFTCVSRHGAVFLWAARLPGSGGGGNRWFESALEAAEEAKSQWVRMTSDMAERAYSIFRAHGNLGEPKWPDRPFRELIEIAFKGRVIESFDHEVLKEWRGAL